MLETSVQGGFRSLLQAGVARPSHFFRFLFSSGSDSRALPTHATDMGNSPLRSEYAYPVPGTGGNGETAHYRSVICKEQFNGELIESLPWADVKTCHDAFVYVLE
jgi:hypothetical protein